MRIFEVIHLTKRSQCFQNFVNEVLILRLFHSSIALRLLSRYVILFHFRHIILRSKNTGVLKNFQAFSILFDFGDSTHY